MRNAYHRLRAVFYNHAVLTALAISVVFHCLAVLCNWNLAFVSAPRNFADFLSLSLILPFYTVPLALTVENIAFLTMFPKDEYEEKTVKRVEILTIVLGFILSALYFGTTQITFSDWPETLHNSELHSPIEPASIPTVVVIALLAFAGYLVLRFASLEKQPPLVTVLCIAAMYLGIAECILWCVQLWTNPHFYPLCLFPANCVLIAANTIRGVAAQKAKSIQNCTVPAKFPRLSSLLNNASALPWLSLLAAIPLLGIIAAVLILFGQQPDSVIRAWTQTANWNLSQQIAPPNVSFDEHYLCTVAAGGHKKVVKPLRTGKRHGHQVLVNRQLCIANSFEQLLEERAPRFHRRVRSFYDKTGYPIARHIRSPYAADIIYFVMKPLEWLFLIILYLLDTKPENRIAVQYPHAPVPK